MFTTEKEKYTYLVIYEFNRQDLGLNLFGFNSNTNVYFGNAYLKNVKKINNWTQKEFENFKTELADKMNEELNEISESKELINNGIKEFIKKENIMFINFIEIKG